MTLAIVTGSGGLIGSEASRHFHELGLDVWGIDNDLRKSFFGEEASTHWMRQRLEKELPRYRHFDLDIRDREAIDTLFQQAHGSIQVVIHAAAQPSHDWAASDPHTDFTVNANGTLTLLEAARRHAPDTVFVFCSTNKVYGDTPNQLPLIEFERRFDLPEDHDYYPGIPETMGIDQCKHSLFGVSKTAADLMVQEYGRYFGLQTVSFRGGCLTGPAHAGAELHGFLAYLMKCTATGRPYTIFGYKGKQVRDNIHSADLAAAFEAVMREPRRAAVYNIGGGRAGSCSILEGIDRCQAIVGRELEWSYSGDHRAGDHIWWITDTGKFEADYPLWRQEYDLDRILREIYEANRDRWCEAKAS